MKKLHLEIVNDPYPENPRDWDNLGTMVCSHRRYTLGDEQLNYTDYTDWTDAKKGLMAKYKTDIFLPLYLYDHSGITMSTRPFTCKWDSGQVGFIYATKEAIRDAFGVKRISKQTLAKAITMLINEINEYNMYLSGEVYGAIILDDNNEQIDSCYGLLSREYAESVGEEMLCALQPSAY
jgi:hypothetical protein